MDGFVNFAPNNEKVSTKCKIDKKYIDNFKPSEYPMHRYVTEYDKTCQVNIDRMCSNDFYVRYSMQTTIPLHKGCNKIDCRDLGIVLHNEKWIN
jgi:hypothetical protein